MKYLFIIISEFVLLISSEKYDHILLPNLPIGEYQLNFKSIVKCNSLSNSDIQINLFLSKSSNNETQVNGNMTLNIPLDDAFTFKINMAVKDSVGLWKDSAHVISLPKACSTIKQYFGSEWKNSIGFDMKCPVPPGVYVSKGFDITTAAMRFLPKTFFYGSYKNRFYITDSKNNIYGCIVYIMEIKRPWEKD